MKRIFTFGLMLTAVFALTNCTEELVDQTIPTDEVIQETVSPKEEGIPFQVYASLGAETKTEGYIDGGLLKTEWEPGDKISVFYAKVIDGVEGTLTPAPTMFEITAENLSQTMFTGQVGTEFDRSATYNWYFVYDATKDEKATISNDGSVTVTIGSSIQNQLSANDNTHIGGASNCPMWGRAVNVSGSVTPRVQMSHLASLYEVTIENQTSDNQNLSISKGNIYVYDLGMSISTTGTWMTKDKAELQALVGDFNLNLLTGKITDVVAEDGTNKYHSLHLNLQYPTEITTDGNTKSAKFYFVAAPRQIQLNRTTDPNWYEEIANPINIITKEEYNALKTDKEKEKYRSATKRQDTFTFKVNGAERNVNISKTYNMEGANVYKFTLPVRSLTYPHVSDAFNIQSTNGRPTEDGTHIVNSVLTTSAPSTTVINVNGQDVDAYLIGTDEDNLGTVTFSGFAPDLVSAIPIGFYTSAWNNEPSVMTVGNIHILFPHYSVTETKSQDQTGLSWGRTRYDITTNYNTITDRGALTMQLNINGVDTAVPIELNINGDMLSSIAGGIASKITFSGMPKQGRYDSDGVKDNVIVMNEAYSYKQINSGNLDTFLKSFGSTASYNGFVEILTAPIGDLPTSTTSQEVRNVLGATVEMVSLDTWPTETLKTNYPQLVATVDAIYNKLSQYSMSMNILGMNLAVELVGAKGFIKNKIQLIHVLRDAKITVTLTTTEDGPRLVFWGLDAKGPEYHVPEPGSSDEE